VVTAWVAVKLEKNTSTYKKTISVKAGGFYFDKTSTVIEVGVVRVTRVEIQYGYQCHLCTYICWLLM